MPRDGAVNGVRMGLAMGLGMLMRRIGLGWGVRYRTGDGAGVATKVGP